MKAYFLFHDEWTEWIKADLAASRYPFAGFIVVKSTRPWWGAYLTRRARRLGWLKVVDEVGYRLLYKLTRSRRDNAELRAFLEAEQQRLPADYVRPPVYHVDDINADETVRLLRDELQPDVCILMLKVLIKERVFSIPSHGMLVYHPGVTPEYRGAHAAFWATANKQLWGIGWSLLRVARGIDTGPILAQGTSRNGNPLTESHIVLQHKSHVDGIDGVVATLAELEAGGAPNVGTEGRADANYTHPGLTDALRRHRALGQLASEPTLEPFWQTPFAESDKAGAET